MSFNLVESTTSQAWSNNLPPIGFSVDKSGTAMTVERFPENDCYMKISRPPQSVFELAVYSYKGSSFDHRDLDKQIEKVFSEEGLVYGKRIKFELDGVSRIGRIFSSGKGFSKRVRLACVVPAPNGGPFGLMVVYSKYSKGKKIPTKVSEIVNDEQLSLLQSFVVNGSR